MWFPLINTSCFLKRPTVLDMYLVRVLLVMLRSENWLRNFCLQASVKQIQWSLWRLPFRK